MVWINCTNQFDASVGFGGYRESGYGREGGHEGMFEYLKPKESGISKNQIRKSVAKVKASATTALSLDRTAQTLHRRETGSSRFRLFAKRCQC